MLKTTAKYLILLSCFIAVSSYAEGKWYEGGTLHKASVETWVSASQENKIATAADWTLTSPAVKEAVQKSGDFDTNKIFAQELITCMDTAVDGIDISGGITDIAASCMMLMGWLK